MNPKDRITLIHRIVDELDNRYAATHGKKIEGHHTDLHPDGRSEEWVIFTDGSRIRYSKKDEEFLDYCVEIIEKVSSAEEFIQVTSALKEELKNS